MEVGEDAEVFLFVIGGEDGDHRERGDDGKQISGQINQQRRRATFVEGHDAEQCVACAGDACITEQPFEIALAQRAEAAK